VAGAARVNQSPTLPWPMSADVSPAELYVTLVVLGAGAALAAMMVWLERRPRNDFKPRLLPTTPFLFIGALTTILALVHLLNLLGLHTGRN
jgi:hypothetical protein